MKDLEDIRGRCVIDEDGHWLWKGSLRRDGLANVYAPDFTLGGMRTQSGPRAVWHCSTGRAIRKGYRAFLTCTEKTCCNPAHIRCTSMKKLGQFIAEQGIWKGQTKRILANRKTNRARSNVTPELIAQVRASEATGLALSKELPLGRNTISKIRTGKMPSFGSVGPFAGLGA